MKEPERIARLDAIYAELPKIECQRKCQLACGPLGMTRVEFRRLTGSSAPVECGPDMVCPFLVDGACSRYQRRPLLCRLFGLTPKMPCPHGCQPERWLTDDEETDIMTRVTAIGGPGLVFILPKDARTRA